MNRLEELLTDLAAESGRLDALVAGLDDAGWRTATPAAGWDVAHQIAHLAWTDGTVVAAATDPVAWQATVRAALADPDGFVDAEAARGAAEPPAELLARWRTGREGLAATLRALPADARIPWYGPSMAPASMATARFMETWAHARDVAAALGATLPVDDGVRHVVHLGVRTRTFAFRARGLEPPAEQVRVELVLPSGAPFVHGPPDAAQSVRGPAYHFALLVTQRAHRDDLALVADGPDADRWLDVAQAFAGPPGAGRPAGGPVQGVR